MRAKTYLTARYAETDQMGVIHHSVYPIWYEAARTDLIKLTGLTYSGLEQLGVMTPVVELRSHYSGSARYEDQILVESWVSALSPAKVEFSYRVLREGEEKPLNTGSTLHGWVDRRTFKPVNLKKKFPEFYEKVRALMESEEEGHE